MMVRLTVLLIAALFVIGGVSAQELSPAERARLEAEYAQLQKEIAEQQKIVDETRAKKNTLQGDVSALNAQIAKAQAEIDAKNNQIKQLGSQISTKTKVITQLSDRLDRNKESLAAMLQQERELDEYSLVEIALGAEDLSSFFADVDSFISIKQEMSLLFSDIQTTKSQTEEERAALAKTQDAVTDAKYVVEVKKGQVAQDKTQKQVLLSIAANQEAEYQKVLAANQAKAAAIRAALFPLRDSGPIEFGDAVTYAKAASAKTGVRPALILAVLSQESALGTNIGNCYVTNSPAQGDGVGKNTGTPFSGVMHPTRDVPVFLAITEALGKDFKTTPVSCPQPGGYGGAMGPTQFIPSTWKLFEPRLKASLGVAATNPWNAEHAIMATGLYLGDWSAASGGYTAERNAACAYFSGRACPASGWITSYGDQVMAKATKFQQDIDFLKDN